MISLDDVKAASERLLGISHRTPLMTSATLDSRAGVQVLLKVESLQRTGSFKFRGAYNAVRQLGVDELSAGVVTASSGNHGQAVALAARLCETSAVVVMPHDAPDVKVAAVLGYGAEVVRYHRFDEQREAVMDEVAAQRAMVVIPPYDHPAVMAGQGTVALEILEEHPDVQSFVVPTGGGGLLAGVGTVAAAHGRHAWGIEPEAGDDHVRSASLGERVVLDSVPDTIADGQQVQAPGRLTWPVNQRNEARYGSVTDDEIVDAMRFAFGYLKLVLEPSGACGLAAVLTQRLPELEGPVGLVLSGGNVDLARYATLLGGSR